MVTILAVHQTAIHLHQLARDSVLPGYADKLEQAAIELEELEARLKGQKARRPAKNSDHDTAG